MLLQLEGKVWDTSPKPNALSTFMYTCLFFVDCERNLGREDGREKNDHWREFCPFPIRSNRSAPHPSCLSRHVSHKGYQAPHAAVEWTGSRFFKSCCTIRIKKFTKLLEQTESHDKVYHFSIQVKFLVRWVRCFQMSSNIPILSLQYLGDFLSR